jgi:hypothetical protein
VHAGGQSSACHPLEAHLVVESHFPFRLILYWIRLPLPAAEEICYSQNRRSLSEFGGSLSEVTSFCRPNPSSHWLPETLALQLPEVLNSLAC